MSNDNLNNKKIPGTKEQLVFVKEIFAEIDTIIQSMNDFASEDFRKLNSAFLNLHNLNSGLTKKLNIENHEVCIKKGLNEIKQLLAIDLNGAPDSFEDIVIRKKEIETVAARIISEVNQELEFHKTIRRRFIEISSLIKQNFKIIHRTEQHNNRQDCETDFLVCEIEFLAEFSREREFKLCEIKRIIDEIIEILNSLSAFGINFNNKKTCEFQSNYLNLTEKMKNTLDVFSEFTNIVSDCRQLNDRIIINLQYEDIIRQKLTHINEIHNDILNELEKYDQNSEEIPTVHTNAKLRLRILDTAGLQAAQLIHAHKSFNDATQIIIASIEKLKENNTRLFEIYDLYMQSVDVCHEIKNRYAEILINLTDENKINLSHFKKIMDMTDVLSDNTFLISVSDNAFFQKINDLLNHIDKISDLLLNAPVQDGNRIIFLTNVIKTILQKSDNYTLFNHENIDILMNSCRGLAKLKKRIGKSNAIQLAKIKTTLGENYRFGAEINNGVASSINQKLFKSDSFLVEFMHSEFEKAINTAVLKLMDIHEILRSKTESNNNSNFENQFSHIMTNYTMESEFQIHALFQEKKNDRIEELLKYVKQSSFNNETETEFF